VLFSRTLDIFSENYYFNAVSLQEAGLDPTRSEIGVDRNQDKFVFCYPFSHLFVFNIALTEHLGGVIWVNDNVLDRPEWREPVRHLVCQAGVKAKPSLVKLRCY